MTSEPQDRPSLGIAYSDRVIPFPTPAGRKPVAVCRGAGVATAAPAASPADTRGVAACDDFLEGGIDHLAELGCDPVQVSRWFMCAAANHMKKTAGRQAAMAYLLRLAGACQGGPDDNPSVA